MREQHAQRSAVLRAGSGSEEGFEDSWDEISASRVGSTSELDGSGVVAGTGSCVEIVSAPRRRGSAIYRRRRA